MKRDISFYDRAFDELKQIAHKNETVLKGSVLSYTARYLEREITEYQASHPGNYHILLRSDYSDHLSKLEADSNFDVSTIGTNTDYVDSPHAKVDGPKVYFYNIDQGKLTTQFNERINSMDLVRGYRQANGLSSHTPDDAVSICVALLPDEVLNDRSNIDKISFGEDGYYNVKVNSLKNVRHSESALAPEIVALCECRIVVPHLYNELMFRIDQDVEFEDLPPLLKNYVVELLDNPTLEERGISQQIAGRTIESSDGAIKEGADKTINNYLYKTKNAWNENSRKAEKELDNIDALKEYLDPNSPDYESMIEMIKSNPAMSIQWCGFTPIATAYMYSAGLLPPELTTDKEFMANLLGAMGIEGSIDELTNNIVSSIESDRYPDFTEDTVM